MSPRTSLGLAAALVLLGACDGSESTASEASRPRPNVLWIVVDTLRADHLGAYGYGRPTSPTIDALAARGVRFERAYTTAPWTLPAIVSMLGGELPSHHGLVRVERVLSERTAIAPDWLREAGYGTAAVVSGGLLRERSGILGHFDLWEDGEARGMAHVSTPGVVAGSQRMLRRLERRGGPFLLFAHFFDPHYQYNGHVDLDFAPKRGDNVYGKEPYQKLVKNRARMTDADVALLTGLYDEEIRVTDEGIGALLAELDRRGLLEDTLVVVTADHGEELMERGWLGHTVTLYDELVRVPLIVAGPGIPAGRVVRENVSTRELGLALAELAGALPDGFAPTRLAALARGEPVSTTASVVCEVDYVDSRNRQPEARKRAIVRGDAKLVVDELAGTVELYDLAEDPREQHDLAAVRPELVADLRAELDARLAASTAAAVETRVVDDEELEVLEGLGYAGSDD